MPSMRRVVITGMGVTSPLGNSVNDFEAALFSGRNGIDSITRFDTEDFAVKIAGEVRNLDTDAYLDPYLARKMDLFTVFAMVAAEQAVSQAGFLGHADPNRVGVIVGTGIGGIWTLEESAGILKERGPRRISPFMVIRLIADIAAGQISIKYGLKGPNYCITSACATGSNAIGDAFRLITYDDADVMVAGGCEAPITPISMAGFTNMKALSRNSDPATACRPFDAQRDGFVMSEGAGLVILEELGHAERRGATIHGELVGYGATADAFHVTAPAEGGEGAARAMALAIGNAGIEPDEVGYINAHGTSTPRNDKNESFAIKSVFGDHATNGLLVSSTKSMTGHMLGAAGGAEAIACLLALERQEIPPTIHYTTPDPDCDLNYSPNKPTKHSFEYGLSNTFGFGGHNAVLLLKRFSG